MKRKLGNDTRGPGRRQPQTSCDFCRRKKLKCDRAVPCSNCSARGLACTGAWPSASNQSPMSHDLGSHVSSGESSILDRLGTLEEAIFGSRIPNLPAKSIAGLATFQTSQEDESQSCSEKTPQECGQEAQRRYEFPLGATSYPEPTSISTDFVKYHVEKLPSSCDTTAVAQHTGDRRACASTLAISLMTRDDALLFLYDFINRPWHLIPLVHEPAVRSTIHNIYDGLGGPQTTLPHSSHVALVLGISAACATNFSKESVTAKCLQEENDASAAARAWLNSALRLLEQSQRCASYSLEDIQARLICCYVISNVEGCTARFRSLHNSCVSAAHELGLHLTDEPKSKQPDDVAITEIKRRLWWYIVSNDWLLGFTSGAFDGRYSIQPRHMKVKHVRNINNKDLENQEESFEHPGDIATDTSFLIQRCQLAEVCRIALDTRAGEPTDEKPLDFDNAIYLDSLFQRLLQALPPFFQQVNSGSYNHNPLLNLQRDTLLGGIHSRRALMHRYYLPSKPTKDIRVPRLLDGCFESARAAVSLATKILDPSTPHGRRTGVVVGHLFTSCTTLAMISGLMGADSERVSSQSIKEELGCAHRALRAASENSSTAASLLSELTGILQRHRIHLGESSHSNEKSLSENIPPQIVTPQSNIAEAIGAIGQSENCLAVDNPEEDEVWTNCMSALAWSEGWEDLFIDLDPFNMGV